MTFRRAVYRLHLCLGLVAGGWLAVIGATGAMLVFGREMDAWLRPDLLRVRPAAVSVGLDRMAEQVHRDFSDEPIFRIRLPQHDEESVEFWLTSTIGRRVYADPYQGRVLGSAGPRDSLLGIVRDLHVELLVGKLGRTLVGMCGVCLLVIAISGLRLWWPGKRGWRRAFQRPASASRHVRLHWWHRSLGAVAALPLLLSGATGTALVFDAAAQTTTTFITGLSPPAGPPRVAPAESDRAIPRLDEAIQIATATIPDAKPTWLWMPTTTNEVLAVRLRAPGEWHENGRSFVYLNASTMLVLNAVDARDSEDASRVTNQFYPMHTGTVGGLGMRAILMLAGMSIAALWTTGAASRWGRTRSRSSPAVV